MPPQPDQSLIRQATDAELMPPPPTKRIKRPPKVLDEDTYTEALSQIIARDFFPGLLETKTQQEYLDALESQDEEWIASASRKLTQVMTPGPRRGRRGTSLALEGGGTPRRSYGGLSGARTLGDTPRGYGGDTPMSQASALSTETSISMQRPEVSVNMSLDGFQATYTSEDNESFNKLLDKQNGKRAEKYAWLWAGNKIPAARQIKQREREAKALEAKEAQQRADGGKEIKLIEGPDERKAMPDAWKAKPTNQVFFALDGVEDTYQTVQQQAELNSRAPPKSLMHENTRFPLPSTTALRTIPPSPSLSAIQDAIAGRPRRAPSELGYLGDTTPRVNGYAFVDDEDLLRPRALASHHLGSSHANGNATPSNPFKIKEQSRRESLHHRMVDRVAKFNRSAGGKTSVAATPVPKFASSPRTVGNLTPAAQRLWGRVGASKGAGVGVFEGRTGGADAGVRKESGLRVRWTPTQGGGEESG